MPRLWDFLPPHYKLFSRIVLDGCHDAAILPSMSETSKLRKIREQKGYSRTDLGYIACVSYASVAAYESGRREPSLSTGVRIAEALNVHPSALIEDLWKEKHEARKEKLQCPKCEEKS